MPLQPNMSTIAFIDAVSIENLSKNPRKVKSLRKLYPSRTDTDLQGNYSELTPGSVDVWIELPDEIKFDPSLAPFKKLYEREHGELTIPEENDFSTTIGRKIELIQNGEREDTNRNTIKDSTNRIPVADTKDMEEKKIVSPREKLLRQGGRWLKLFLLCAGWLLLTTALLLHEESEDVTLHAAVSHQEIKEYHLSPSRDHLRLLVTLTGPFCQDCDNNDTEVLRLSLHRENDADIEEEEKASQWEIKLQPAGNTDFLYGTTISRTLHLKNYGGKESNISLRMLASGNATIPLTVTYHLNPIEEKTGIMISSALLFSLYTLIIFELINRTIAALLCSSLAVAALAMAGSRPSLPTLVSWLDVETLLLLFSMMLLVAVVADTGLFDYLAMTAFEMAGGRPWALINCLCLLTALFSTFLDNVTTVLLMTPVTIRLCEVLQLSPVPVLLAMVVFSNVGGAATPVGDPPNLIIASHPSLIKEGINFATFTLHMGVGILLVSAQTYFQLRFMYRDINKLRHSVPLDIQELRQQILVWKRAAASLGSYSRDEDLVRKALEKKVEKLNIMLAKREKGGGTSRSDPHFCTTLADMKQKYKIRDKPLLIKCGICIGFVILVFFLHAMPQLQNLSLGWTALLGALLLLLIAEVEDFESILARVEWSTLLFFAALFVLMEALSKLGLISWIGRMTEGVILSVNEESRLATAIMLVLWVSGLASAFVDNIPLTTMMVRVVATLADPSGLHLPLAPLAWALSFGACLGGNGTLIGASANVVCAGVAEQHGYGFTFMQYLKVGFPIMLGNLTVASVYLLFSHSLLQWH